MLHCHPAAYLYCPSEKKLLFAGILLFLGLSLLFFGIYPKRNFIRNHHGSWTFRLHTCLKIFLVSALTVHGWFCCIQTSRWKIIFPQNFKHSSAGFYHRGLLIILMTVCVFVPFYGICFCFHTRNLKCILLVYCFEVLKCYASVNVFLLVIEPDISLSRLSLKYFSCRRFLLGWLLVFTIIITSLLWYLFSLSNVGHLVLYFLFLDF